MQKVISFVKFTLYCRLISGIIQEYKRHMKGIKWLLWGSTKKLNSANLSVYPPKLFSFCLKRTQWIFPSPSTSPSPSTRIGCCFLGWKGAQNMNEMGKIFIQNCYWHVHRLCSWSPIFLAVLSSLFPLFSRRFPLLSSFLIEGVLVSKNLFSEICLERPKT